MTITSNEIIIGGTTLGVICGMFILSYFAYKKVDIPGIAAKIETVIKGGETITDFIEEHATVGSKVEKADKFAKYILERVKEFVEGTEQMYVSNQISATDRKETAVKATTDLLEVQGFTVDDKLKNVITMYVEKACSDDTIKNINEKIDKLIQEKVTPLQKEKESAESKVQELQTQNSQLTTENANIKNAITTAANTVQSTTQQTA